MADEEYDRMFRISDVAKKYETPYELGESERKSLDTIREMLDGGLYASKDQAREHFVYLEHLENKLAGILAEEKRTGIVNEELPEALSEIAALIDRLKGVIKSFP